LLRAGRNECLVSYWSPFAMPGVNSLIEKLKTFYLELRDGEPGQRFTDFYDEHHRETKKSTLKKVGYPLVGSLLIAAGVILSIPPGVPGFLVAIVGAGMIAITSRFVSRLLDYSEMKARRLVGLEKS